VKKKIAIIDDHVLIAQAIKGIISNFTNFEVLFECENGKEFISAISRKKQVPDIVLLDISMPIMNGFETAKWLQEHHPEVMIMVLSMQTDEESINKMIKNGARSYLLKNVHPRDLEMALNTMLENGYYYPDWASRLIFSGMNKVKGKLSNKLSGREKEFLRYCITEMSYKEIAEEMHCSPRTVEGYRDSLFEKLDLKSRVGLAVYAIKNGFE
jgi:DNA-binding NarL/FixJ family response regulator